MKLPSYENWISEESVKYHLGAIKRQLCMITGVDMKLLLMCPDSEQRKFTSLGAAMFITTALAFISACIAIDYIFPEIGQSTFISSAWKEVITVFLATLWTLIIYNLQRFIISGSSRTSDSDRAGLDEFIKALPGIVLSVVIGLSIALPIEVAVFKPEIEMYLSFSREKERIDKEELAELESYSELLRHCSELYRIDRTLGAGVTAGCLPVPAAVPVTESATVPAADAVDATPQAVPDSAAVPVPVAPSAAVPALEVVTPPVEEPDSPVSIARKNTVESIEKERAKIDERKRFDQLVRDSGGGLVSRVRALFDASPYFAYSILLIILFVQLTPVLIKAMAPKSPYDYFEDMQNRIVLARGGIRTRNHIYGGIEPKAVAIFDENGDCKPVTIYHHISEVETSMLEHSKSVNDMLAADRIKEAQVRHERLKALGEQA